jgi:hypothetical protein
MGVLISAPIYENKMGCAALKVLWSRWIGVLIKAPITLVEAIMAVTTSQQSQPTWLHQYQAVLDEEELARTQQRIADCGKYCIHIALTKGRKKIIVLTCGKWRNQQCPKCFDKRKKKYQNRILTALHDGVSVYMLPLSKEDLVPDLSREDYLKLPADNEDGGVMFYNATNREKIGTQVLGIHALVEEQWDEIVDTPEGKRPSGSLGKKEEKEEEGEGDDERIMDMVEVHKIKTATDSAANEAWNAAVQLTSHLPRTTVDEVIAAYHQTVKVFIEQLQAYGVEILEHTTEWMEIDVTPEKQSATSTLSSNNNNSDPPF